MSLLRILFYKFTSFYINIRYFIAVWTNSKLKFELADYAALLWAALCVLPVRLSVRSSVWTENKNQKKNRKQKSAKAIFSWKSLRSRSPDVKNLKYCRVSGVHVYIDL